MDFGLSQDQQLFQETLRGYLAERVPVVRVREIMESESGCDTSLRRDLGAQGVTGVVVAPEHGGSGLGLLDAAVAAEELGAAAAPFSFHSACVMAPLALAVIGDAEAAARLFSGVCSGETLLSYVPDGPDLSDGKLAGSTLFVPDATTADAFVVLAGEPGSRRLFVVPADAPGLVRGALSTVDETRRVGELVFDGVEVGEGYAIDDDTAARVLDAGRIVLAADALGSAQRALDLAVQYALERKQFGRVIGSFQAVKHMCAETAAEVEPVRSLLWYGAFAWDERRADAAAVASILKAHATEVATTAVTTCVQVFGGMGFTHECDVQLWFKRAGYDRQMLGSPVALRTHAASLGTVL
ncbi:MAG: acyl-CoA dehydrogenase [Myxococcales bacterium]|jgi:alkylation response protein AidB-like acyl-CoA dehydrogenase|nr:MAG: acyl-CoA dehydrogenase [Myxococcales bacterium]